MSEGQILRNEDNAFLPLSSGQISLLCEFCLSHKALCQAAEKTLKQHTWVSSPLQVRSSLMFNCEIRDNLTMAIQIRKLEQDQGVRLTASLSCFCNCENTARIIKRMNDGRTRSFRYERGMPG